MSTPNEAARLRLPIQPSLEHLKKQAKRRAKSDALQLAEAQHRLAVDYGFASWPKLVAHIESVLRTSDWHSDPNDNLPKAANNGDVAKVKSILASGQYAQPELDLALGRIVCNMGRYAQADRWIIADLLIAAGADPDGEYGNNYGPLVFAACEGTDYDGIKYLIDHGADVGFAPVDTKYGRQCPLSHLLGTYERGKNDAKHKAIDLLLARGAVVPPEVKQEFLAIHRGDAARLAEMIAADPDLPRRRYRDMPYGNMRLRGATLLHMAVEHGEIDCIDALLDRWSDCNLTADIVDGLGGQSPVFHAIATNQGRNLYTLEHLVKRLSYGIECHRIRATFKIGDTLFEQVNAIEYAERMSGDDVPTWQRASPRELELVRSVTWPGIKRKTDAEKTPTERLQEASRAGDFDAVKRLVESGEIPTEKLNLGIEGAALAKREDIARYLIDHGADINADYIDNYGPVLLGFCEGLQDEQVEFVLKLGARADWERRPTSKYPHHSTPLRMTCETYVRGRNIAKHRILDMLIAHGATPEDDVQMTIHRGDAKKLDALLKADPSLKRRDRQFKAMFNFPAGPQPAPGTLLHLAVEHNEIACIDTILSHYRSWDDSDINSRAEVVDGVGGHTPLFLCANSWLGAGYPTLQYLVKRVGQYIDASIVATVREGDKIVEKTVLQYAGQRERKLLEPFDRRTQIRAAIRANDVATFTRMLDEHPDLASPAIWPDVIHRAKSLEMTRMLLDRGVDPSACPAPRKPLHLATYYSLADIIELLVERGADVNFLNPLNERPIDLIDAYEPRPIGDEQSRRSREALIKAGATHNIHSAVRAGDVEVVRRMLDADPSLVHTPDPWNPLFTAARAGRLEVAKLLIERGAVIDGTNDKGNTPLWFACQSPANAADRIAIAELLLDHGANPRRDCEDGTTALHFAASRGPLAMVELLIRRGAKEWQEDSEGKKPIDHARIYGGRFGKPGEIAQIIELLDRPVIRDPNFKAAVAAIQSGDLDGLKKLLVDHPNLVHDRAVEPDCYGQDYFRDPKLLWFVANNPYLIETMPRNVTEIASAIIDAGAEQADLDYTLGLVCTCQRAREQGLQRPLITLLLSRGARMGQGDVNGILGHKETDAMRALLEAGHPLTAPAAAGLGMTRELAGLLKTADTDARHAAFSMAVINGHVEAATMCLDAGADIDAFVACHQHSLAVHQATVNGDLPMLKMLVERGARLDIADTLWNGTPLGWAIHTKQPAAEAYLRSVLERPA